MKALTAAIQMQRWDLAALLLAHAFFKVTSAMPADAVYGLLEALEGISDEPTDQ